MRDDCGFTAGHDEGMTSLLQVSECDFFLWVMRRTDSSSALRTGIASIVWPWGRSLLFIANKLFINTLLITSE